MPYSIDHKNKCVYKKKSDGSRGEKVGCTKGSLKDYIAALQIHAENKIMKEEIQEPIDGALSKVFVVQKPYSGCQLTSLVKPIDPLLGIGAGHELVPEKVHAVFADKDIADKIANELYEKHVAGEQALEEKKEVVSGKLKKTLDALEKKRKEHMDQAKENPKDASGHREQIAKLTDKIDDLMSKLEKIEKSKKEKTEDKKSGELKKKMTDQNKKNK